MSETIILQEMIDAGVEQLKECENSDAGSVNTVVLIYLAMRGIEQMVWERNTGSLH